MLSKKEKEKLLTLKDKEYPYKAKIIDWIIKKQEILTIGELSRRLDRSKETIIKLIDILNKEGYDIRLNNETKEVEEIKSFKFVPKFTKINYKKYIKIGLLGDTHFGSIYQQLSLLHEAYNIMSKEGVNFVIHAGDLTDGPLEMHKRTPEEVFIKDTDEMIDYVIKNYPKSSFKTYVLDSGTHDTFWKRYYGINVVRRICENRPDLILRRGDDAQFVLQGSENVIVRVVHPVGGVAYARSYKPQKLLEGILGEFLERISPYEKEKTFQLPHIFALGHFHVYNHLFQGGVECFSLPCFQAQTPYLRDKGLYPNIGFIIVELHFDSEKKISRIRFDAYRWNAYAKKNDY